MAGCGTPSSRVAAGSDVSHITTARVPMPKNCTKALATLALAAAITDTAACQDVIVSELGRDANGSWIEIHNRGAVAANVSAWSIYLATTTVGMPRAYWWGFRPNTVLPAGSYLVVRWMQPIPAVPVPGEVATGNTNPYFLFGLGAEPVPQSQGALALFRTQFSGNMSSATWIADWVSWGGSGLTREDLAIQNGAWRAGNSAPSMPPACSLARHPGSTWSSQPELAWFVDETPTPGGANVGSAALVINGSACAPMGHSLLGAPTLGATSMPVLGNSAFGLTVDNTTGVYAEWCIFALSAGTMPFGRADLLPPTPGGSSCLVMLDPSAAFGTLWTRTAAMRTSLPMSLQGLPAALAGQSFAMQALVFDMSPNAWPPYKGVTNALTVTIGN